MQDQKGMMVLRLLNFLGGFDVEGELGRRDGSRGERGGVDMGEGVLVWMTGARFVELDASEGDTKGDRGLLDWETGEGTIAVGLGERGGVGIDCVREGCGGLAEGVTDGESRIIGAEWVGLIELLVC